jgi:hypothetical protein
MRCEVICPTADAFVASVRSKFARVSFSLRSAIVRCARWTLNVAAAMTAAMSTAPTSSVTAVWRSIRSSMIASSRESGRASM